MMMTHLIELVLSDRSISLAFEKQAEGIFLTEIRKPKSKGSDIWKAV